MILSSKYEMQKKNFVIDYLRGLKISRGGGGQNIVRYFDPWVELV